MVVQNSTTLDNGLRIFTAEQPGLHSVNITFAVRCGSRHETQAQWGLSHLLEHMLFRGSRLYPDCGTLAQVFEGAGGSLEASTWRDHTHYSVTIHPDYLRPVLAALSDMLVQPLLIELPVERNIVEEELRAELDEDGGDADVTNVSRACIWADQALGRGIIGSVQSLRRFDRADLLAHHRRYYTARNSVLSIAGAIDSAQVQALCAAYFAKMPPGSLQHPAAAQPFSPRCSHGCIRTYAASQLGMQLTFPALPESHVDFAAQLLLTSILDDGMATRLPRALCDKQGLVYDFCTGLDCYSDVGVYDIEMQLAPHHAATALQTTRAVLRQVREEGVQAVELETAKARHLHELTFRQDSTADLALGVATRELFCRSGLLQDEANELVRVRPSDVLRVARRMLQPQQMHLTLMGPARRSQLQEISLQVQPSAA